MQIDLEALERLAKAAGADAGLGTWDATGCVVWFPDGDSVFEAGYSKPKPQYRPVGVAFTNIGAWPDPVDEDAVGEFIAAVCPDAVLALIAKVRELEQDREKLLALSRAVMADQTYHDTLAQRVNELEQDAARYRYLRDEHIGDDPDMINLPRGKRPGLDAAIDAAMAASKGEGGA